MIARAWRRADNKGATMSENVEFTRGFGLARLRDKTKSGRSGSRMAGKMHIILALPGAIFAAQTRAREELRHRSERSVSNFVVCRNLPTEVQASVNRAHGSLCVVDFYQIDPISRKV